MGAGSFDLVILSFWILSWGVKVNAMTERAIHSEQSLSGGSKQPFALTMISVVFSAIQSLFPLFGSFEIAFVGLYNMG
jgi:hypothetical protein